jgi:hypothetical protein
VLRHDALHIRCEERDNRPEVARAQRNFGNRLELLGDVEVWSAHFHWSSGA